MKNGQRSAVKCLKKTPKKQNNLRMIDLKMHLISHFIIYVHLREQLPYQK